MFVHVTVLLTPITTTIDGGLKAYPWMFTLTVDCATATGEVEPRRSAAETMAKPTTIPSIFGLGENVLARLSSIEFRCRVIGIRTLRAAMLRATAYA